MQHFSQDDPLQDDPLQEDPIIIDDEFWEILVETERQTEPAPRKPRELTTPDYLKALSPPHMKKQNMVNLCMVKNGGDWRFDGKHCGHNHDFFHLHIFFQKMFWATSK